MELWLFETLNIEKAFTQICTNFPQILEGGEFTLIMPAALGINTNSRLVKGTRIFGLLRETRILADLLRKMDCRGFM